MRARILSVGIAVVACALLVGCSSAGSSAQSADAAATESSTAAASPSREAAAAGPISYVTDTEFRSNQLVSGRPSIVAFTAPWCGSICDTLKYQLEANWTFYGSAANFLYMDVEANASVMQRYGIRSVPTLMCFTGDQILARRGAFLTVAEAENWITGVCGV